VPQKNSLKTYVMDGYYHIYNRGVEKRTIFTDKLDHKVFLSYLKEYLSPKQVPDKVKFTLQGQSFKGVPRTPNNYANNIKLLCYCLLPNHFHLLIRQHEERAIESFMRSLQTRYSMYFNKRHQRIGGLYQDRYKAINILDETYLLHLSRYIHLNPLEYTKNLESAYSSYAEYLGKRKTKWLKSDTILSFFDQATIPEIKKTNSYKEFVENYTHGSKKILGKLTLED